MRNYLFGAASTLVRVNIERSEPSPTLLRLCPTVTTAATVSASPTWTTMDMTTSSFWMDLQPVKVLYQNGSGEFT
jgi:hypothetical protein